MFSLHEVSVCIFMGNAVPPQPFEGTEWDKQQPSTTCTVELARGTWEEFSVVYEKAFKRGCFVDWRQDILKLGLFILIRR